MNEIPDPLEAELAALRPHEPSPRLRQRIADHRAQAPPAPPRRAWRAAALAATVLLGLNLVLALDNARHDFRSLDRGPGDLDEIAAGLRRHDPELPATEARRQALLVLASGHLTPQPDPATFQTRFLFAKDDTPWDMR
jgi:hypothetical protein